MTLHTGLTGRRRHRANWCGKLILQVEVQYYNRCNTLSCSWRDATVEDISKELGTYE